MGKPPANLSRSDLEHVGRAIAARTGLVFPTSRENELSQCLTEVWQESTAYRSFEHYLRCIEDDTVGKQEMRKLIARLTVGETYFFRNRPQFDLLRDTIIPQLVQRRARLTRCLRVWSAGCSTGEEAYSVAMLLCEALPRVHDWEAFILGTDISEDALRLAEQGVYREWSFRDVEPYYKDRFFTQTSQGWKIHPEIRKMVTFRYLNLIEDSYPLVSTGTNFMDIILCRNVLIYFRPELSTVITRRFFRALNNGGYLLLGHAEHNEYVHKGFRKELHPKAVAYVKLEKHTGLDRALRLRFRGSGFLPPDTVPLRRPPDPKEFLKAVKPGDRLEVRRETALFEEGAEAYRQGQNRLAMSRFREVLDVSPRNHRACYMMALMEADQGNFKKAEEFSRLAIEAYPLSLEAHYLMAVIAREKGDREKEMEYLKKVLYINQDFFLGQYQIGTYYLREGNLVLARKFFRNVLKLLDKWKETDKIEGVEGMTVGCLRGSIRASLDELEADKERKA